jgi:hypothetical protein
MNIEFELPLNNKNIKGKNICIPTSKIVVPDYLIDHLLTNRQKKKSKLNKSKIKIQKHSSNISNISNKLIQSTQPPKKRFLSPQMNNYDKIELIKENKRLKEENQKLKETIKKLKNAYSSDSNLNFLNINNEISREKLANLILTMSYEKQSEEMINNFSVNNSNIKFLDNEIIDDNKEKDNMKELNKIYEKTKNLFQKYQNALSKK